MGSEVKRGVQQSEHALTVAATATAVSGLHWASGSLFELFVLWASEAEADRGDVAVWLSTTGRHLGEQARDLKVLMPDSVLLADLTEFGSPSPEAAEALNAIRAIPGSVVRLAISQRVLLSRLGASCESLQRLAQPHADAPLLRVIGFLLADVKTDREKGELLLGSLRNSEVAEQISRGVLQAESHLVSVGGLVPVGVVC